MGAKVGIFLSTTRESHVRRVCDTGKAEPCECSEGCVIGRREEVVT